MKTKLLFLALGLSSLMLVHAQNYEFKVMMSSGANQVNTGNGWENVKNGSTLQSSDKIKVASPGYMGLVHRTGKTVQLKESGEFAIADLATQVGASGSGVAAKYADFVLSKMAEAGAEDGDYRQNVNVTGAVKRAVGESGDIVIMMPTDGDIMNDVAVIRWNEIENAEGYKVILTDMFNEPFKSIETGAETRMELDLNAAEFQEKKSIGIKIEALGTDKESAKYVIERLPEWESEPLKEELKLIVSEVDDDNALGKIILASFYEQNNLLLDALTNYEQAIELEPDIDDFKLAYQDFLMRNGLGR